MGKILFWIVAFIMIILTVYSVAVDACNTTIDDIQDNCTSAEIVPEIYYDNNNNDNSSNQTETVVISVEELNENNQTEINSDSVESWDNSSLTENNATETTEAENNETITPQKVCNPVFNISTEKGVYSNETVVFRHILENCTEDFVIEYWVEDDKGVIVKKMLNTTNLNKKSFTPAASLLNENINVFFIRSRLFACNATFYAEKMFSVIINNTQEALNSENESQSFENQSIISENSTDPVKEEYFEAEQPNSDSIEETQQIPTAEDSEQIIKTDETNKESIKEVCRPKFEISTEKEVYSAEKIEFKHIINDYDGSFVIEYWIENRQGEIIKKKISTTNLNKKSFTPSSSHLSEPVNIFLIRSNLFACNATFYAEKIFVVALDATQEMIDNALKEYENEKYEREKGIITVEIVSMPSFIYSGNNINLIVEIKSDDEEHVMGVWSFIYEKESAGLDKKENFKKVVVEKNSITTVVLENIAEDLNPGMYEIEVSVLVDDENQRNIKSKFEIRDIIISKAEQTIEIENNAPSYTKEVSAGKTEESAKETDNVVYKSKSLLSKNMAVYFILSVFVLVICYFIFFKA